MPESPWAAPRLRYCPSPPYVPGRGRCGDRPRVSGCWLDPQERRRARAWPDHSGGYLGRWCDRLGDRFGQVFRWPGDCGDRRCRVAQREVPAYWRPPRASTVRQRRRRRWATMRSDGFLWLLRDARHARKQGPNAIAQRQRTRLSAIVAYARAQSPYFRALYRDLPDPVQNLSALPVTHKKHLMVHYDEWVTDRAVTIEKVRTFVRDPSAIGDRFLDRYTAVTTSGTTGTPGIFLWDEFSMTVTYVLALRMLGAWLRLHDVLRIMAWRTRDDGVRDRRARRRSCRGRTPAAATRRHRCSNLGGAGTSR